ncbi:hypothetical protein [Roseibium sp. RKSG952]|nr:hypothetical protein [Roseibium sp. RKSG952]
MTALELALIAACVTLVLLPLKWDPPVRLNERNLRKRKESK